VLEGSRHRKLSKEVRTYLRLQRSRLSLPDKIHSTTFKTRSKTARYGFIGAIRGVAACLVLLEHSLYQSGLTTEFPGFIPDQLELGETGVVAFFLA
jgi:hypothetical protein